MKICTITPIVLTKPSVLKMFLSNFETWDADAHFIQINKLDDNLISFDKLVVELNKRTNKPVAVFYDNKERSVAAAWNRGIIWSKEFGCDASHILAFDVALNPNVSYFLQTYLSDYDLISSSQYENKTFSEAQDVIPQQDFCSIAFKNSIVNKFGWFDKEYFPAYYEDCDYIVRLINSGGKFGTATNAIHHHLISSTIGLDENVAKNIKWRFQLNRERFINKWGNIFSQDYGYYNKSPFNSEGKDIFWWPEQDNPNYEII